MPADSRPEFRTFHQWAPMLPMDDWWHWCLFVLFVAGLLGMAIWICRRDTARLARPVALAIGSLRVAALLGLVVLFLGPQRKTETRITRPSELLVLADTSLSMGLGDGQTEPGTGPARRIDPVIDLFAEGELLEQLNRHHRIRLFRFGDSRRAEEILTLERNRPLPASGWSDARRDARHRPLIGQRWIAAGLLAAGILVLLACGVISRVWQAGPRVPWVMCGAVWATIAGLAWLAVADLASLPTGRLNEQTSRKPTPRNHHAPSPPRLPDLTRTDWEERLNPRGTATRLGDAVMDLVRNQRSPSTAGILLFTDGGNNQGIPPSRAIAAAADANLPFYAVGAGSRQPLLNARISEVEAPPRVYPGDRFQIRGVVQTFGMAGKTAAVQLLSADRDQPDAPPAIIDEVPIELPADGEPQSVEFTLTAPLQGVRQYTVRIQPPAGDLDPGDNQRQTTVEAITRKTRILLIAGGPSRDYRFLRNQLFRDNDVELDVWLQMANRGADQESDRLLSQFPDSAARMAEYDCLIAFDPDWRQLSLSQTAWLEDWISNQAGGMVVVAGPVFTPEWTRQPRGDEGINRIRRLYPVSFYRAGSATLKLGRFGGNRPFPLKFSREGLAAGFLQLGDTAAESQRIRDGFPGVYGYYAVSEPKAGADILAWFSDPETAVDGKQPIYLATHFYGAGRVFFQASGEIWRMRDGNDNHFQTWYLNLIRWVSQGRMLRDSRQGVLLLDRNRCWVGDPVIVRALLKDPAGNPLTANEVQATVRQPDGVVRTVPLHSGGDANRPGSFTGQFPAVSEGIHQIRLPVPGSPTGNELVGEVQASIPDLEKIEPQRNDALLSEMAERTAGRYFADLQPDGTTRQPVTGAATAAAGRISLTGPNGLSQQVTAADQQTWLPGTADPLFDRRLAAWLAGWIAILLCGEWILRRLFKLA